MVLLRAEIVERSDARSNTPPFMTMVPVMAMVPAFMAKVLPVIVTALPALAEITRFSLESLPIEFPAPDAWGKTRRSRNKAHTKNFMAVNDPRAEPELLAVRYVLLQWSCEWMDALNLGVSFSWHRFSVNHLINFTIELKSP